MDHKAPLLFRHRYSLIHDGKPLIYNDHHDHERAGAHWQHCVAKVRSIGFFSRHIQDKHSQRVNLTRLLERMRTIHEEDKEELERVLKDSINRIHTMRPPSPKQEVDVIPCPEEPTWKPYEIKPGTACALCKEYFHAFRENDGYPCRICNDVFHKECLQKCGDLHSSDLMNLEMAKTNIGWSCPICANISLILTDKEIAEMTALFERFDVNKDCHISLQEYVNYKKDHIQMERKKFTDEDDEFVAREFKLMDQNADGCVDWWEFVNHESKMYLARRPKAQLVHLLTEKELMAAKATFTLLDVDGDGRIKEYEALKSYKQWFKHFEKRRKSIVTFQDSDLLDYNAHQAAKFIMDADEQDYGDVTWRDYILDQALYIISTRPNMKVKRRQSIAIQ